MRKIKRLAIFLVFVFLAAGIGLKWWVRTDNGGDWVRRRLSSALAMPVSFDSVELLWTGRLALRNFRVAPEPEEDVPGFSAYELRLVWIPGLRGSLNLRRPELVLASESGAAVFSGLPELGLITVRQDRETFEKLSESFREDWDLHVRDGRVKILDSRGRPERLIGGFDWECKRVEVAERRGWYQRVNLHDRGTGEESFAPEKLMEWISLENLGIIPIQDVSEGDRARSREESAEIGNRKEASEDAHTAPARSSGGNAVSGDNGE